MGSTPLSLLFPENGNSVMEIKGTCYPRAEGVRDSPLGCFIQRSMVCFAIAIATPHIRRICI